MPCLQSVRHQCHLGLRDMILVCICRQLHSFAACRLKRLAELAWPSCWTTSVPADNSSTLRHTRHCGKTCHATCMRVYTSYGSCKGA
jgi:hypothetical protein